MAEMDRSILEFEDWLTDNQIEIEKSLIEIKGDESWGIIAKEDVKPQSLLSWIPLTAVLSVKNSTIAKILEEEEIGGGLALVIAATYEKSLHEKSKWHGYFRSMPEREYLPVFWTEDELEALDPDLIERVRKDREFMKEDFEEHFVPLMEKYPDQFNHGAVNFEDFRNVASLVSSRAFFVDDNHGNSMVPLADVFNHKCARVVMDKDHGLEGESSSEEEVDLDNIPCDLRLEITICSSERNGIEGLEIRAAQFFHKGSEIHNTYGELDNEELLLKYGFCVANNPFERVCIEKDMILKEVESVLGRESFQTRLGEFREEVCQNLSLLPEGRLSRGILEVLDFFFGPGLESIGKSGRVSDKEIIDLSSQADVMNIRTSAAKLDCLKSILKRKQESIIVEPKIIKAKEMIECKLMMIIDAIKSISSISVVQDLQQSSELTPRTEALGRQLKFDPILFLTPLKRKFVEIWCTVDD